MTFVFPLFFLFSKPLFLDDHFTTHNFLGFGFFQVLAISLSDKAVDRSIPGYAFTWLSVFALSFMIFTKKEEGIRAIWATRYKNLWREIY